MNEDIGERLKQLRKHNKLTQEQCGEMIGYNKHAVLRWEKGKNSPKLSVLKELVEEHLDGNFDWVMTGDGLMNKHMEGLSKLFVPEVKPPLGLIPEYIHKEKRINDIFDAMERYCEKEKAIPEKWVTELRIYFEDHLKRQP